jgi:FixJ family two-component response regulator
MSRLLSSAGWEYEQFSEPTPFLDFVQIHRTPVAVVDIWMPKMHGLEVQSQMRKISPSTRAIMITGQDDPLIRATALKSGAFGFFLKPFDDEEFLTAVRMALAGVE